MKQTISANGKLLLSSEYFVLDGAKALAVPTRLGQQFTFEKMDEAESIFWKSFDEKKQVWFEGNFNKKNFESISSSDKNIANRLAEIFKTVQQLNPDFFQKNKSWTIESHLDFPRNWGLGTSSTLIYSIAQWAGIDPFELLENTFGGSGYDLACAGAAGSLFYQIKNQKPTSEICNFSPIFKDQLYFIFLGKKQNSREGIRHYRKMKKSADLINEFSMLSQKMLEVNALTDFEKIITEHEELVSVTLHLQKVKNLYFSDFWGSVKSLGAWGGDFVLATSDRTEEETKRYFNKKGFEVFFKYDELILSS